MSSAATIANSVPEARLELPLAARVANSEDLMIGRSPKPKTSASSPRSAMKEKNAAKLRDNAVTMQLSKTKMCAFFERGKCASANCRYAHSASELRLAPNMQKTKLCRAFLSGECNDENCYFAHGETDLRVTEGIYKTQICNFFERGYCKKGDRCNHAHGLVDLRPAAPTAATPGKMSPSSQSTFSGPGTSVKSSQSRRSPLPLSELLVIDAEANAGYSPSYSTIPPTPTKSVTELAQMAFSPIHSSPLWAQYGMQSLSPMGALAPVNDLASMWPPPRDAVDILVQDQRMSPTNLMYSMDMMEPRVDLMGPPQHTPGPPPQHTPKKIHHMAPSPPHRPAPGLLEPFGISPPRGLAAPTAEPFTAPPVMCAPGLEEPTVAPRTPGIEAAAPRDPLMLNLSERLASLDAVVLGLGNDIAAIKSDPRATLHRI